jgi:hypothetical protein
MDEVVAKELQKEIEGGAKWLTPIK